MARRLLRLFDPVRDRYLPVVEEETVPVHEAIRRLDAAKRQVAEAEQRAARAERRAAQLESELRAVRRRSDADG